ncbi:F-box/WD repeat-containing protein [Criblamydia sequanensis]|uniref:F-box and WD repeat-containing protein n=1 Tax=Candidatus Criblamydia sequanensis CRIB-18 TaxID=1437425 RepID=A0A090D2T5_9BACT|nr:F-box/WD40 repeat-containing protein [Criblamydia sequanensis]CDR34633.1 F-box and WD repeat-containing protein [Criblamydia sequanensis CRIB-18]
MYNRVGSKPSIIEGLNESEEREDPGIHSLPAELMIEIFSNLDFKSLNMAALTCKLWNILSKDSALIRTLFVKSFPESSKTLSRTNIDDNFLWQQLMADARMRSTSGKIEPNLTKIKLDSVLTCLKIIEGNIFAGTEHDICVLNGKTGKEIKRLKGQILNYTDINMSKGKLFSSSANTIRVWDFEKGRTIKVLSGHTALITKLHIFDGTLISTAWDNTIRLWDIETGSELKVLAPPNYFPNFCLSDGKIFSITEDHKFYIWDAKTGDEIRVIQYLEPIKKFISAKGKLFIALKKGVIHLLDIETNELKKLEGHSKSVTALIESQGKLFSASKDRTIRIWDVETGKGLRTLEGHSGQVTHINVLDKNLISYSGDLIFSPKDKAIRLWDIETGKELRKFETSNISRDRIGLEIGKIIIGSNDSFFILDFNQKPQDPLK